MERNAATRAALVDAAIRLFGERGYEAVSTEQIVREAGVTRGALYHHFKDKRGLFVAAFDKIEADSTAVVIAAVEPGGDARHAAVAGARAYLEYCRDPAVKRLMFDDARAVIDETTLRGIVDRRGGALIRSMAVGLLDQGAIRRGSVDALAAVVTGMLIEGAAFVGRASDQERAVDEITDLIDAFIAGLASG